MLTIEEPNGDTTTNTWNGENRLVAVEQPDFTITTYIYDAEGHRIETDDGVDITRFLYDGNNLLQEKDDLGVVEAEFTDIPMPYAHFRNRHVTFAQQFTVHPHDPLPPFSVLCIRSVFG